MRTEDDEWFDKVQKLGERFNGEDPDESIRRIARQEADKRIAATVNPIVFVGSAWLAHHAYGTPGLFTVLGLGVAYFLWSIFRDENDPKTGRHLIVMHAEDLNRLKVITEAHEAGEQVWVVREKEYDRDKRKIVVFDGDRWDGSWRRVHGWALELERIGPKERQTLLMKAATAARSALAAGWPAAGLVDTEIRCFHLSESRNAEKEVQPRVQARGGKIGSGAGCFCCAGRPRSGCA